MHLVFAAPIFLKLTTGVLVVVVGGAAAVWRFLRGKKKS